MTTRDTSGGAFPFSPNDHSTARMTTSGMSLRDWFAGQALAGLLSNALAKFGDEPYGPSAAAQDAYAVADAMLVARQEEPPHDA